MVPRNIGLPELLILAFIVLLLFGVGRVSRVGKELGSAIREFRKGLTDGVSEEEEESEEAAE
jgi:sec-independent protein translocase protein TatA